MRFVKRISLFFIYPLFMYALGFVSNMLIMEYFYPGEPTLRLSEQIDQTEKTNQNMELQELSHVEKQEVAVVDRPIITANTQYNIQKYDITTGLLEEEKTIAPDKFIGMNRERLIEELDEYNQSPPLTELNEGFRYIELVSFSPIKIVVKKSYESIEEETSQESMNGYFLLNDNHYVVVYDHKLENVYMNTGILVEDLPETLQNEIIRMKYIENEGELFNFLESFSS